MVGETRVLLFLMKEKMMTMNNVFTVLYSFDILTYNTHPWIDAACGLSAILLLFE